MPTYLVNFGHTEFTVSVRDGAVVAIDGKPLEGLTIEQPDRNRFTVLGPEGIVALAAVRSGKQWDIVVRGVRLKGEVRDERDRLRRTIPRPEAGAGPREVRAPMPALVARLEVRPGDSVERGQTLVVLEAMKMENDVRAAVPGTVRSVEVTPGMAVEKDQILMTIT